MASGEDFIFRPLRAGMFLFPSLKDGSISLYDIARMNECLDIELENGRIMRESMNKGANARGR